MTLAASMVAPPDTLAAIVMVSVPLVIVMFEPWVSDLNTASPLVEFAFRILAVPPFMELISLLMVMVSVPLVHDVTPVHVKDLNTPSPVALDLSSRAVPPFMELSSVDDPLADMVMVVDELVIVTPVPCVNDLKLSLLDELVASIFASEPPS